MKTSNSVIGSLEMELAIDAPPAKVWQALTENIGAWWPDDFFAGGEAGNRTFSLEAEPGGRMFESWADGGGALWGTVICVEPEKILQILGAQFPNWGGPLQWYGTWTLQPAKAGTRLQFSESVVGRISDAGLDEKDQGWKFLWATLKSHVEGTPAPVWGE